MVGQERSLCIFTRVPWRLPIHISIFLSITLTAALRSCYAPQVFLATHIALRDLQCLTCRSKWMQVFSKPWLCKGSWRMLGFETIPTITKITRQYWRCPLLFQYPSWAAIWNKITSVSLVSKTPFSIGLTCREHRPLRELARGRYGNLVQCLELHWIVYLSFSFSRRIHPMFLDRSFVPVHHVPPILWFLHK